MQVRGRAGRRQLMQHSEGSFCRCGGRALAQHQPVIPSRSASLQRRLTRAQLHDRPQGNAVHATAPVSPPQFRPAGQAASHLRGARLMPRRVCLCTVYTCRQMGHDLSRPEPRPCLRRGAVGRMRGSLCSSASGAGCGGVLPPKSEYSSSYGISSITASRRWWMRTSCQGSSLGRLCGAVEARWQRGAQAQVVKTRALECERSWPS